MKTTRTIPMALAALTILLGLGLAGRAEARIRVQATLSTPHVGIVIGNGPVITRPVPLRPLPVRVQRTFPVSKRDQRIARRLARYTGVSRGELIRARRMGYTWREIGAWLGVPPRVLQAAMSSRHWEGFPRSQGRHAGAAGNRGHAGHCAR